MVNCPGYFLTWHTYGTWLHGDEAGSVDASSNRFGASRLAADPQRFQREHAMLRNPPVVLSPDARATADEVMRQHCAIRKWDLRALNVRSNHVHVVVANPTIDPEPIVKQLKEWATRRLRERKFAGPCQLVWADHASTIYLYEDGSLDAKIRYVNEMQDDPPEGHGRQDWKAKYLREP